jgi:Cd(II)/Pb(II)-responsive transcriptional regulator
MTTGLRIGELAKRTNCQIETIRYYEREGLLHAPERTDGNYRLYQDAHVERLRFIRQCRSLDMALDEIRTLLRFCDAPEKNCGEVNGLLDERYISQRATRVQAEQQKRVTDEQKSLDKTKVTECFRRHMSCSGQTGSEE